MARHTHIQIIIAGIVILTTLIACSNRQHGAVRIGSPANTGSSEAALASGQGTAVIPCITNRTPATVQFEVSTVKRRDWQRQLLSPGGRLLLPRGQRMIDIRFVSVRIGDGMEPANQAGVAHYRVMLDRATRPGYPRPGACLHEFRVRPDGMLDLFLQTGQLATAVPG